MMTITTRRDGSWRVWRAWLQGVKDAYVQTRQVGELSEGISWEPFSDPRNEAYDRGANLGERIAELQKRIRDRILSQ